MNRRDYLKAMAALPLCSFSARLCAAEASAGRLLLVFLRGGYDAANLLVPSASTFYYEARPGIAIAPPGSGTAAALALDADWSLHPALRDTLYPLYQQGELAFVPFAGTEDRSRSHFETQDSIELGQPLHGPRDFSSGFLNRLAGVLGKRVESMSFTDQLPLIMQGPARIANSSLHPQTPAVDARRGTLIEHMYGGGALAANVHDGFAVRAQVQREMQEQPEAAGGFETQARRIARMMRSHYALGFVDIGGWDTHVNQGGAEGALAHKLAELGRALVAYRAEMGAAWRTTTVVVMSEFGRTFRENGKNGTDHGHGSVYWVLGGGVRGARIAGAQVRVTAATLFEQRDYPVLNEYRAVLGGLFARIYGLNAAQSERVFAGVKPLDLGLL